MGHNRRLVVLGIDPGLKVTGYGLILQAEGRLRALDYGVIKTDERAPRSSRLRQIYEGLSDVLLKNQPDEAAVEDFVTGHVRAAIAIGEARAAALLASAVAGVPVSLYKPLEIKQSVTSYGRGSKEQVQTMVQALLSMSRPPDSTDAADALAIALCHCLRARSSLSEGGRR